MRYRVVNSNDDNVFMTNKLSEVKWFLKNHYVGRGYVSKGYGKDYQQRFISNGFVDLKKFR